MRFSPVLLAGLVPFVAAAPTASAGSVSMMAENVPQWTIESMKRTCDAKDTSCVWSFGIQNNRVAGAAAIPCTFTVKAGAKPASQTDVAGIKCAFFTVSEGWSDQFGLENAFTTLSIANFDTRLIAFPAYTAKELADGKVVSPNRSYQPQKF
ncbi:uncharacterized protein B0I36DRAFT_332186 [Microdochium trichocladiopsis]|uniref:Small secreted protein n=1 Tax=Microdochium trichocladiopsis TaxID=1682393 RepID=A0A9P9BLY3_9PEZI|nr:uncharacterized protein B0I36DRAFT_332186 [Microdochium trichocladiopsis]KAH7024895.1 hypothetical protein B0I36DRAFT_332186 [Microdochium trichocladiopsis]